MYNQNIKYALPPAITTSITINNQGNPAWVVGEGGGVVPPQSLGQVNDSPLSHIPLPHVSIGGGGGGGGVHVPDSEGLPCKVPQLFESVHVLDFVPWAEHVLQDPHCQFGVQVGGAD